MQLHRRNIAPTIKARQHEHKSPAMQAQKHLSNNALWHLRPNKITKTKPQQNKHDSAMTGTAPQQSRIGTAKPTKI